MKVSRVRVVVLGSFAVLVFVGVFQLGALGQTSGTSVPAVDQQEKVVTRVYNVRDLIRPEKDYPAESQVKPVTRLMVEPTPPPTPIFHNNAVDKVVQPSTRQDRVNTILELIRSTIAAESWRENSGTIGTLREMDGALVATQTEANQRQVEVLLEQLRKSSAAQRTVQVQARWLELDGAQLEKLLAGLAGKTPAEVAPDAIKDLPVRYRAQITGMEGQNLHLAAGREQTILSKLDPIVSCDSSAVAAAPKTEIVHWGAILELSAVVNPDGMATVDFSSLIAEPGEMKSIPMMQAKASTRPAVGLPESLDRLEFNLQSFGGTAKVPLGKPVLIGGSNLVPPGGGKDSKLLYLVLEVSASK